MLQQSCNSDDDHRASCNEANMMETCPAACLIFLHALDTFATMSDARRTVATLDVGPTAAALRSCAVTRRIVRLRCCKPRQHGKKCQHQGAEPAVPQQGIASSLTSGSIKAAIGCSAGSTTI
jgi:hypothetical protein